LPVDMDARVRTPSIQDSFESFPDAVPIDGDAGLRDGNQSSGHTSSHSSANKGRQSTTGPGSETSHHSSDSIRSTPTPATYRSSSIHSNLFPPLM